MADESRMFRYRVGDVVTFTDNTEWPPTVLEGTITDFANEALSYLTIDFGNDDVRVLTEDEVTRVA